MKILSTKAYKSNFQKKKKDKIEVTIEMTPEMFSLFKEIFENPTAKALLKVAVKLNKDSGNPYRDIVTDLLHLASLDIFGSGLIPSSLLKIGRSRSASAPVLRVLLYGMLDVKFKKILNSAWDVYLEEKEELERVYINKIKNKDLPLYIDKDWEFEENKTFFLERLKND